ncbi:SDR family NAD(P)-dependent oxidoreductase [Mycobacterium yunnanensis]|uniref:SDR family NAD(P)-dependent oxidoreductase n=1 Tax=Mycobacterium yunnanensis TaxID=368477 RepID=A0A9X2Z1F8_9MYCO|nr:SDR family NAD(P)-dependent oxidoreductase [Mycobacterium yunnanensis]
MVTGASSGIGLELARLFANDGYDLLVVADEPGIHDVAEELSAMTTVQALQADLRQPDEVERVHAALGRVPAAIALNAGIGRAGRFVDADASADLDIVDLNVRSTVHLAKLVLRDMADAGAGRALFTSSIVAMMPGSYQTMYNASKSFIQSFAVGLHDEFRGTGVTVTALMPGATDTEFFRRAAMVDTPLGRLPFKDDPARTARQGYDALMRGDRTVIASSLLSKVIGVTAKVMPDSTKAFANRLIVTPFGDR